MCISQILLTRDGEFFPPKLFVSPIKAGWLAIERVEFLEYSSGGHKKMDGSSQGQMSVITHLHILHEDGMRAGLSQDTGRAGPLSLQSVSQSLLFHVASPAEYAVRLGLSEVQDLSARLTQLHVCLIELVKVSHKARADSLWDGTSQGHESLEGWLIGDHHWRSVTTMGRKKMLRCRRMSREKSLNKSKKLVKKKNRRERASYKCTLCKEQ